MSISHQSNSTEINDKKRDSYHFWKSIVTSYTPNPPTLTITSYSYRYVVIDKDGITYGPYFTLTEAMINGRKLKLKAGTVVHKLDASPEALEDLVKKLNADFRTQERVVKRYRANMATYEKRYGMQVLNYGVKI